MGPDPVHQRARQRRLGATLVGVACAGSLLLGAPAYAADAQIDYVEPKDGRLQVLVSLPEGTEADLDTATVTFEGEPVEASAESFSEGSEEQIRRTAIIAMDVSNSMRGEKFDEAVDAAEAFLDSVPDDVHVGLVTFADDVRTLQEPTQDTETVRAALDELELSPQTSLYDGVIGAVDAAGDEGARTLLVLSDGRDTSTTPLTRATTAVEKADVHVDVVALAQNASDTALLQQLAKAGKGDVLSADDPTALSQVFAGQAEALAQQVLVTVEPPADSSGAEGTLSVTLQVDGEAATDEAFVALPGEVVGAGGGEVDAELPPVEPGFVMPKEWMYAGLGAASLAVMVIIFLATGGSRDRRQDLLDRRIEAYTRKGAKKLAEASRQTETQSMTQQAVAVAENVLEGQKGLESALGSRLDAAGLAVKPAEWLLIHIGIAIGLGLFGLMLGGGSILYLAIGLFFGMALPWMFLSFKRRRRLATFKAQLADTLQLMSGSLSAGLSLAQSVDTVVREGSDPMASEFRRALIETRLGIEIEEALMGIADRMQSVDFEWVVMAIRIQRSVGGNLSELLTKVSETIREREYLERQVKTLSAEGRLSVWVLGGLPPAFMAYLLVANRTYVEPMYNHPIGWAMLVVMAVLLTGGIFWMKKLVKVEV